MDTTATDEDETTTEEESEPVAEPDAKYSSSCDMRILQGSGYSLYGLLVGDTRLRNTGNVGIVVRVRGMWERAGFSPFEAVKKTRVDVGRRTVIHLRKKISQQEMYEVEGVLGYLEVGRFCRVKVSIIGTYGQQR